MSASNTIRRAANLALILSFLAVLWLPTCDWLWDLDRCPKPNENRKAADFPKNITAPGRYLAAFGNFFEDHFGFRNQLVHWNTHWKMALFNESPVSMVMRGKHGWLYYAREGMVENYTGKAQFSQETLLGWQKLLETRRDWVARRGGKYIFVVAPNKESIYPEFLPDWVVKSGQPVKLDQFMAHMRSHSTVPVLDLRPGLIAAKSLGTTFLRTDTHWNSFGAFAAYRQLISALQIPDVKPLGLDSFTRTPTMSPGGDLAVCIEQELEMPETQAVRFHPRTPLAPLQQALPHDRKVRCILTENPYKAGKVVFFRDSFADAWVPFVGYHFNQVIYFRQGDWSRELVEREKPGLVIDEIVERTLNSEAALALLLAARPQ